MKNILFVYPHNFLEHNMGTNIRVYSLAEELCSNNFQIDLYACRNFVSSFEDFDEQNKKRIVRNLYLYDYKTTVLSRKKRKISRFVKKVFHRLELDNWVTPTMIKQFDQIVSSTHYDYIVMFYAYTAELISPVNYSGDASKIYFMEDFLSLNRYISGKRKFFGSMLESEINRIANFDKVVCISWDEKFFFEKLLPNCKFYFFPHIIDQKGINRELINAKKKVLFIGYDNEFNKRGLDWFFECVYHNLIENIEIVIVGKISNHVREEYPNLHKIEYVEDLDELYRNVDIVMCPLLNGTGLKIKVIEAMSYSIPVVCTDRGVDGFPDKYQNGCLVMNTPQKFADAINQLSTNATFYQECQQKIHDYFASTLDWKIDKDIMMKIFGLFPS